MDINGKTFNEGWGTEKMGKKCMYVTDIYKMHGSFQALGIKRPQSLNLSNRHTLARHLHKRQEKSSFNKKGGILPPLLLQGRHLFKDLTFPETSTLATACQMHCQGCAVCSNTGQGLNQQISHFPNDNGAVLFQNNKSTCFMLCALKLYSICDKWSSIQMATETQPNHTEATKLPQLIGTLLSKPPAPGLQLVLPSDETTYLPHVVVQPDVLRVLPQAVLPPLRGGAAAGPAAGKSERENVWAEENQEGKPGSEAEGHPKRCSKRRRSPSSDLAVNAGASWCLTSAWEGLPHPGGDRPALTQGTKILMQMCPAACQGFQWELLVPEMQVMPQHRCHH